MKRLLPSECPSCASPLVVSSLECTHCGTVINGRYPLPALLRLSSSDQDFIFDFILLGGSLKAMAKQLGNSYPTVRNKLDDIIEHLQSFQNTNP